MSKTDHILLSTLGTTWAIIPEVYGIFTGIYGDRSYYPDLPSAPKSVWIITTLNAWDSAKKPLTEWSEITGTNLEIFKTEEDDLTSQADVAQMRELIFRVVLKAREDCDELSCSLAGGRKTMSADMQEAARLFGCNRLLHVISNGTPKQWPDYLRNPSSSTFSKPLPSEALDWIVPVVLPGSNRADFLDVAWDGHPPVLSKRFPPKDQKEITFHNNLTLEIEGRRADSGLLSNFIAAIEKDERHENWRSLYRLPPRLITKLRQTQVSLAISNLLRNLPKAELHCHIGGILDLPAQRRVAEQIWNTLESQMKDEASRLVETIHWEDPRAGWRDLLKYGCRPANVAAVFQKYSDAFLESVFFPSSTERTALKHTHPLGFSAYELPGELTGSAVLGHPAAIEPTVDGIIEFCRKDNIRYLELRGSPHKYATDNPILWLQRLKEMFRRKLDQEICVRFVWIADRRQVNSLPNLIKTIVNAYKEMDDFLVGVDLAGDEGFNQPENLTSAFFPAFEACLPITIHAGEGESADNIWQAAYHLHADRIGHGLSLAEHPQLLKRFRNRGVCLELCPTSNREVVGFCDPNYPQSHTCSVYPLRRLWNAGVPLTLCTDNPGISRCSQTGEYITAARMIQSDGGLTLWEAMAMMKRAFLHAFADTETRSTLMKSADLQVAKCFEKADSRSMLNLYS